MQNILAAFMGLRALIIFNVCDTPGCKPVYGQENNGYVLSASGCRVNELNLRLPVSYCLTS